MSSDGRALIGGVLYWCIGCVMLAYVGLPSIMAKSMIVKWGHASVQGVSSLSDVSGVTVKQSFRIPPTGKGTMSSGGLYTLVAVSDTLPDAMETLRALPGVVSVEENYPVYLHEAVFSDTLSNGQYYLNAAPVRAILEVVPTRQVLVAVLDTGASLTHPDLQGKWWVNPLEIQNGIDDDQNGFIDDVNGYAFLSTETGVGHAVVEDPHGHGTHISGLIAAHVNNAEGVVGVAPMARILPVRMIDVRGVGYQYDAAAALVYAVKQGASVINCSWGFSQYNEVLQSAIEYALANRVIVVAAAGNSGTGVYEYPASFPGVIGVGSLNSGGNRSYFSNHHARVKVYMFGEGMVSTGLNATYKVMDGTSQAAGLMSGLLAHFISAFPAQSVPSIDILFSVSTMLNGESLPLLSPTQALRSYSVPTAQLLTSMTSGVSAPFSTVGPAVTALAKGDVIGPVTQYPNPLRDGSAHFSFVSSDSGQGTIRLYGMSGQLLGERGFPVLSGQNVVNWDLFNELRGINRGTYLYVVSVTIPRYSVQRRGKLTVLR